MKRLPLIFGILLVLASVMAVWASNKEVQTSRLKVVASVDNVERRRQGMEPKWEVSHYFKKGELLLLDFLYDREWTNNVEEMMGEDGNVYLLKFVVVNITTQNGEYTTFYVTLIWNPADPNWQYRPPGIYNITVSPPIGGLDIEGINEDELNSSDLIPVSEISGTTTQHGVYTARVVALMSTEPAAWMGFRKPEVVTYYPYSSFFPLGVAVGVCGFTLTFWGILGSDEEKIGSRRKRKIRKV